MDRETFPPATDLGSRVLRAHFDDGAQLFRHIAFTEDFASRGSLPAPNAYVTLTRPRSRAPFAGNDYVSDEAALAADFACAHVQAQPAHEPRNAAPQFGPLSAAGRRHR